MLDTGEDSYSGGSDSETSDHNKTGSSTSSASATPTAELQKYKFDHMDTYSISDVLICHTDKLYKNCVIWVIRRSGNLEALVFEAGSEDSARQLYRKFHEVSKRSKLERHRRRKSDGGSIITKLSDLSNLIPKSEERGNVLKTELETVDKENPPKWNLVQHTDKNGVTHIEVESSLPTHLVRQRDSAEPRSLLSFSPPKFSARGIARNSGTKTEKSKFAKELESILSTEIKRRDELGSGDRKDGDVISGSRSRPHGESLSLRQRAPALLIRKLDEFEEKAHRIWAKAEAEEENRKVWSKSSNSVIGISSPPRGPQLENPLPVLKIDSPGLNPSRQPGEGPERKDDGRTQSLINQPENLTRNKQKDSPVTKKDEPNRILIPTKTGKEPPKKLYPKESPPIFSGRFVPLGMSSQPHSLPIYPVQVNWNRMPAELTQLDLWKFNQEQQWRQQPPAQERTRSRDRSRIDPDLRRRAQSKSPARRPNARLSDPNPGSETGFTRIFREFGVAVRSRMGRKGEIRIPTASDQPEMALKSNLKKQGNPSPEIKVFPPDRNSVSAENRKVHFNKFATVQMMG